jgi:hypothetical protein
MSTPPALWMSLPRQTLEPESYLSVSKRAHHGDEGQSSASSVFDYNVTSPKFTTTTPNRPSLRASPSLRDRRYLPSEEQQNTPISCIVISGGTGCNAFCSAFEDDTVYILPVSDDGGSSSEIIRVLGILVLSFPAGPLFKSISPGGPSIGDIRSRLIRLIPASSPPAVQAIRTLISYRFPSKCTDQEARDTWREVVEGRSSLWYGVPADRKELIRGWCPI